MVQKEGNKIHIETSMMTVYDSICLIGFLFKNNTITDVETYYKVGILGTVQ